MKLRNLRKHKKAANEVFSLIMLGIGMAVITLINIFAGALGGQVWQGVEADVNAITNANISENITAAAVSSFQAQADFASYLPIAVLAFIIIMIMGLIVSGFAAPLMGGYGGGYNRGYGGFL